MKRFGYVDIYKFIGIMLMVMGHIGFGERFDFFIHAFHMPMFFFISGFLYNNKSNVCFKDYFLKKFKSLIVPYFSFGLIHLIISIFLYGFDINYLKHLLFINSDGLPIAGALWFLTALFFVDIFYFLISKFIKNDIYEFLIILCLFLVIFVLRSKYGVILPFSIGSASSGLLVFFFGVKLKDKILNINSIMLLLLIVIDIILIINNGYVNIRTQVYSNILLFYLNSVLSSIIIVNISLKLELFLKNNFISKFFQYIGKNSIIYVCLNQVIILLISNFLNFTFLFKNCLILILSVIVLNICSYVISNTRLKFLVGRC